MFLIMIPSSTIDVNLRILKNYQALKNVSVKNIFQFLKLFYILLLSF